jgi:hypothetical protein
MSVCSASGAEIIHNINKLKVHKNENFVGFDFELCTYYLLIIVFPNSIQQRHGWLYFINLGPNVKIYSPWSKKKWNRV